MGYCTDFCAIIVVSGLTQCIVSLLRFWRIQCRSSALKDLKYTLEQLTWERLGIPSAIPLVVLEEVSRGLLVLILDPVGIHNQAVHWFLIPSVQQLI